MLRWPGFLAAAVAVAAWPATAGDAFGCGGLAPFGTSCEECCEVLGDAPEVSSQLLGYVGALEMRLATAEGALAWRCSTVLLDGAKPVAGVTLPSLETCEGPWEEGRTPHAGSTVALRCRAVSTAPPAPPEGPWGCTASP